MWGYPFNTSVTLTNLRHNIKQCTLLDRLSNGTFSYRISNIFFYQQKQQRIITIFKSYLCIQCRLLLEDI